MGAVKDMVTAAELALAKWPSFEDELPPLVKYTSIKDLRDAYEAQPGENHWFEPKTLEYWGSSHLTMHLPGITVEYQDAVPESLGRWAVSAWFIHIGSDRISVYTMERFDDEEKANYFADILFDMWNNKLRRAS